MIWFRGRKNCQRISENRRIKRSRESGFSLTRYLLWCVYDLPDDCKTLILAVGGSSKGLGAAGIDADQELARTDALISAAKEKGIIVLALHTGGSARRGTLSDSFITPAFQGCDAAIVVSEGDSDGLMSGILSGNGTPAIYVDNTAGTLDALKTAFGL